MAIQTQDFYANGLPTGIQANAGIVYTNLADGKQYKQKTIPFGSNWVSLGTTAYFYYQSSGSLPSQSGKAGKYLQTDGANASWESVTGGIASVGATAPIESTGGTTPVISIPKATSTQSGYLYSVDWATFNAKQDAITKGNLTEATSSVLTISGGTASVIGSGVSIQVKQASSSQSGYLSSTDWTTFNNKGNGTVTAVSGTAPIVSSGGATPAISMAQSNGSTSGYLSSTDWNTFNSKYNQPGGDTSQYIRGDGSIVAFPTLPTIVNGTVDIDFGVGNNLATVAVHSTDVLTTSNIIVVVNGDGVTATHNAYEHRMAPLKLTVGAIVDNTSFEIYATTDLLLSGSFNLKYTIT